MKMKGSESYKPLDHDGIISEVADSENIEPKFMTGVEEMKIKVPDKLTNNEKSTDVTDILKTYRRTAAYPRYDSIGSLPMSTSRAVAVPLDVNAIVKTVSKDLVNTKDVVYSRKIQSHGTNYLIPTKYHRLIDQKYF